MADAQHGANLHCVVIDELHIHKSPDMVETLETGTGSRDQPLVAAITTADDGRPNTIYSRKRKRIEQLAARLLSDPTTYGVVFAADEKDDPFAEATWRKANPGFGFTAMSLLAFLGCAIRFGCYRSCCSNASGRSCGWAS